MIPSEFIRAVRDGIRLDPKTIEAFVLDFLSGRVADYQMSAFLMAVYLNGLSNLEVSALTEAYIKSGLVIDWSDLQGIPVDKHSTGGVGDKVSLILAPLAASCGAFVPMLSGRGLGHTGGTLDKLESITGFSTDLSIERFKRQVREIGCAMARQSSELAPADGRIYTLRDVTATVESIPLISASIMSKKIAEGTKGLVIDLKTGSGSFMYSLERTRELGMALRGIAEAHGLRYSALITDMSQPLGSAVGNALEVEECIRLMRGEADFPRLRELTVKLTGEMLFLAEIAPTPAEGQKIAKSRLEDGSAMQKFKEMIEAQGGNPLVAEDTNLLAKAPVIRPLKALRSGFVASMDTRLIGMAAVELGAGRRKAGDEIDPSVGFRFFVEIGDKIRAEQVIAEIHARDISQAETAGLALLQAIRVTDEPVERPELITEKL